MICFYSLYESWGLKSSNEVSGVFKINSQKLVWKSSEPTVYMSSNLDFISLARVWCIQNAQACL